MSGIIEAIHRRGRGTMQETMGFHIVEINDEHAVAEMPFRPELAQLTGVFHTGALVALADGTATCACIQAVDPTGESPDAPFPLAIQLSVNLVRNTNKGKATAEARVRHKGRTTIVVETTVRDDEGRTLIILNSTHLVLPRSGGG